MSENTKVCVLWNHSNSLASQQLDTVMPRIEDAVEKQVEVDIFCFIHFQYDFYISQEKIIHLKCWCCHSTAGVKCL